MIKEVASCAIFTDRQYIIPVLKIFFFGGGWGGWEGGLKETFIDHHKGKINERVDDNIIKLKH